MSALFSFLSHLISSNDPHLAFFKSDKFRFILDKAASAASLQDIAIIDDLLSDFFQFHLHIISDADHLDLLQESADHIAIAKNKFK